jgi:hypothetical protein
VGCSENALCFPGVAVATPGVQNVLERSYERFHRTLREDALNHFIFLNARHVQRVAREFIEFYNRARPSQATHAIPDPYPELLQRPAAGGKLIALPVLGGVQHDYRLAV